MVSFKRHPVISMMFAAAFISLLVSLRSLSCDFVNWDDSYYVLGNTLIRSLDRNFFITIFTSIPYDFYIPLTTLSFAIDYHFWGLNPIGYHLTNILLHAINAGLIVLMADRLLHQGQGSREVLGLEKDGYRYPLTLLLAGLLWSIHPLRVESVTWVTERKDVLNGLFTLSSILFYLRYVRGWDAGEGRRALYRGYIPSFIFFLMSLMSKPSSLVLPFMLLVLDWYPLRRFQKVRIKSLLLEKLPFGLLTVAIIPATIVTFAEEGALHSLDYFPLAIRVIVTGNALFEYFWLMIFPIDILPFYNLPLAVPKIYILRTAVVTIGLILALYWGRKRPWLIAALACFILPLVPILPFLGNGASIALAARYTYLPAIMPSILLAALISNLYTKTAGTLGGYARKWVVAAIVVLLVTYGVATQKLIDVWKDSATMWSRVIEYQPFDLAYFYRGLFYRDTGNYNSAVEDFTTCITLANTQPFVTQQLTEIYNLYAYRGESLVLEGRYAEAVDDFSAAIEMYPQKLYYYYRSMAFEGLGRIKEAEQDSIKAEGANGKIYWFPKSSATQ